MSDGTRMPDEAEKFVDEALAQDGGNPAGSSRAPGQAQILVSIAEAETELFHNEGCGFIDVKVGGHRETYSIKSSACDAWLRKVYYDRTKNAPSPEAMKSAQALMEAKARYDGVERKVSLRVAGEGGKVYLDLGTPDWSAIEIDEAGWRASAPPPVRFRRSKGLLALSVPQRGKTVEALRPFLNVKGDGDFALLVAWLVASLRGRGPYPILVLTGEQGTAKSTLARVLKSLVDANQAPLRSLPREDRDLFIAAHNGHVLAFDNVSSLAPWQSDSLCRLATEGAFATRELYTNSEEVLLNATRPIILNGIEDFATRGDLADRAVTLQLEVIPEDKRRDEETFWAEFAKDAPYILGALLDGVVCGLKTLPKVKLDRLPRMADFARWGTACEPACPWSTGRFLEAYESNRAEAGRTILEADPVALRLQQLITYHKEWRGTAAHLLKALADVVPLPDRGKDWPKSPRGMSGALRRVAPSLRRLGFLVELDQRDKSKGRTRLISLRAPIEQGGRSSEPSEPSASAGANAGLTPQPQSTASSPSSNHLSDESSDALDGSDGRPQVESDGDVQQDLAVEDV